jgi:hypothetical protein
VRVYAESNYVLELVSEQSELASASELIADAAAGKLELVVPAFCFVEPYTTLFRRASDANVLQQDASKLLRQVERTGSLAARAATVHTDLEALLAHATQQNWNHFEKVSQRLLATCRIAPLTKDVLVESHKHVAALGLQLPDAVVLASVLADLSASPAKSIFVNKNVKDFDNPTIRALLQAGDCDIVNSFTGAIGRARAAFKASGSKA